MTFTFINSWTGFIVDPIIAFQISQQAPQIAYIPLVILYPGIPDTPFFDGQNITHFFDLYHQLCSDYRLSKCQKIYQLP